MNIPDAALGSIIAAAIGGVVVFISTVLTKEQKTSEFRQIWIDEVRKDISQYVSGATEFAGLNQVKIKEGNQVKFLEDNFKLIHELQSIEHRLILRLNPIEHSGLVEKLSVFRQEIIAAHANGTSGIVEPKLTKELLDDAKLLLKTEWKRVKRGEITFRIVKWSAVGIFFLSLVIVAMTLNQPDSVEKNLDGDAALRVAPAKTVDFNAQNPPAPITGPTAAAPAHPAGILPRDNRSAP